MGYRQQSPEIWRCKNSSPTQAEVSYTSYICSGMDEQHDGAVLSLVLCEGRFLRKQEQKVAGNVKKSTGKRLMSLRPKKSIGRTVLSFGVRCLVNEVWAVVSCVCLQDFCTCFGNKKDCGEDIHVHHHHCTTDPACNTQHFWLPALVQSNSTISRCKANIWWVQSCHSSRSPQ